MENGCEKFSYRYSAKRNREVENIRKRYLPKEENKLDTLKALDYRVQTAGMIQALSVGVVGCLIFGIGMCFGLDVFMGADWLTVLFCAIGAAVMIPAYPIYRQISRRTREKLVPQILSLSEEIISEKK